MLHLQKTSSNSDSLRRRVEKVRWDGRFKMRVWRTIFSRRVTKGCIIANGFFPTCYLKRSLPLRQLSDAIYIRDCRMLNWSHVTIQDVRRDSSCTSSIANVHPLSFRVMALWNPVRDFGHSFKLVSDSKPCLVTQDPISTPPSTPMAQNSKLPGFGLPVRWIPNIDMYPATLMPCGSGPPDQCVTDQFANVGDKGCLCSLCAN